MTYSLIKKGLLIALGCFAFLGLAKWVGVAAIATPTGPIQNEALAVSQHSDDLDHDPQKSLTLANQKAIKVQLNVKDNPEYQRYKDKLDWLVTRSSLRGTQIGGAYPIDANGDLIAHISIRHRFDYFMTLLGELSYAQLIALIEDDIQQSLQDPARTHALSLLENYQAYKYALKSLDDEFSSRHVISTDRDAIINRQISMYQAIDMLRYDYFEPEYRVAFFEQDIKSEQALIATLQGVEKTDDVKNKRKITGVISTLEEQSINTGEDLFSLQAQEFGVEAAQRLSNVRDSRAVLKAKVLSYLENKNTIEAMGLSQETQNQEITNLIVSSFSKSEQKRLPTLVKMVQ
jgi:lipase chaperone LimK